MKTNNIKRPALRYYGGKWRMCDQILKHFPYHKVYLEPFFGGGSILLKKERSKIETVNDLDDLVVNYFEVLRERPQELLQVLNLTPWSRSELQKSPRLAKTPLEKARLFFLHSWASIGHSDSNVSLRVGKTENTLPARIMLELDYLLEISKRLLGVQIENLDALDFVERYHRPKSLIYLDPPYISNTRSKANEYHIECGDDYHGKIFDLVDSLEAFVVVSGYNNPLYEDLFSKWTRIDFPALANSGAKKTESIWLNDQCMDIQNIGLFAA